MSEFIKRTLTGIVLVAIIMGAITWGYHSFILLALVINLFSLFEFYRLFYSKNILPAQPTGILLSLSILVSCSLVISNYLSWKVLLINIPLAFIIFIAELYRRVSQPFHNLAFTFLGIICITVPLCFFIAAAFLPVASATPHTYHYQLPLGYFLILWANDTGAYILGKTFGKRTLFKRISPRKTWEGSAGGMLCAVLIAYLNSRYFGILSVDQWIILSVIIVVTGTFGDLIKSLMKRNLNLKDSGTILPGHGGMLDRFDSLLGSAPFVFCYLILFGYA